MCTHSNANKEKYNEKTLEKLWDEYLSDECSAIKTNEEKLLAKGAIEKHKIINELLTKEQNEAVEKYIDAICEIQGSLTKKAFFKGCEFAVSFLIEAVEF